MDRSQELPDLHVQVFGGRVRVWRGEGGRGRVRRGSAAAR